MSDHAVLLRVEDLRVEFPNPDGGAAFRAVDDVSFTISSGETLGIVGESGCGKSTLARAILRLGPLTTGQVWFDGREISTAKRADLRELRRELQVVFQDPLASLNPRMTAGQIIAEPLAALRPELSRKDRKQRVKAILEKVGLAERHINGYPHEFSGGQCQRIGIARALVVGPRLLICDEPVSALDVSIQAQIVNLLMDLQAELGLTLMFIAHDLAVVRQISHRVLVMNAGQIVESGPSEQLYSNPRETYTRELLAAVPVADPVIQRQRLEHITI